MARNHFTVANSSKLALSGGVNTTLLQILAASNSLVCIQMVEVTFDGTSSTAVPVQIDLLRQSNAGTMSALTPRKIKDTSTTLTTTAQEKATAEPTASDLLHSWFIHPQAGVIHELTLPDGEIEVPGSARLGLRINAPAAVDVLGTIRCEE